MAFYHWNTEYFEQSFFYYRSMYRKNLIWCFFCSTFEQKNHDTGKSSIVSNYKCTWLLIFLLLNYIIQLLNTCTCLLIKMWYPNLKKKTITALVSRFVFDVRTRAYIFIYKYWSYSAVSLELGAGVDGKYLVVNEGLTNSRMLTSVRTRPRTT